MRFYGKIGYAQDNVETAPGVISNIPREIYYMGDVNRNTRQLRETTDKVNSDISARNTISIVADAYANEHIFDMLYIEWQGVLWDVQDVSVEPPRLVLQLGGIYNGPTPS